MQKTKGFQAAGSPPLRVSLGGTGAGRGLSVGGGGARVPAARADGSTLHVSVTHPPRPRSRLRSRSRGHGRHAGSVRPVLRRILRGLGGHAVISGAGGRG